MPVEVDPERGALGFRLGKAALFLGTPFDEFEPAFSPDGRFLAYASNESGTYEVYVRPFVVAGGGGGDSFAAGKPRVWTETRLRNVGPVPNYDLAPDGKRLAAMVADKENGENPLTQLTFLLNFTDELRRKAPTGK